MSDFMNQGARKLRGAGFDINDKTLFEQDQTRRSKPLPEGASIAEHENAIGIGVNSSEVSRCVLVDQLECGRALRLDDRTLACLGQEDPDAAPAKRMVLG